MNNNTLSSYITISFVMVISLLLAPSKVAGETKITEPVATKTERPVPEDGIILSSGKFYLQQDMLTDRSTGIDIRADDVMLDLRGHAIRYTGTPVEGTFGVVAKGRKNITIANGTLGGFWFNLHCTQAQKLRIHDLIFDDIPYIGINAAQSKDVGIRDNSFKYFRYDLRKPKGATYVVGINIGAENAVISGNSFDAEPATAGEVEVETVFVLFSANVSKNCVVTHNDMTAHQVLPRSYGIWIASNAQATVAHNHIHNMKYGVCLATDANALVCFNRFSADTDTDTKAASSVETFGINSAASINVFDIENHFDGISLPSVTPSDVR